MRTMNFRLTVPISVTEPDMRGRGDCSTRNAALAGLGALKKWPSRPLLVGSNARTARLSRWPSGSYACSSALQTASVLPRNPAERRKRGRGSASPALDLIPR